MSAQGKRLQLAREHAGYKSGRQAAMRLGWTYPTYAAHESGWRVYPPKVARKYSKAFGVAEEWLLFGRSPPDWYDGDAPLVEVEVPVRYMPIFSEDEASDIEQTLMSDMVRKDFCISDDGTLPPNCFAFKVPNDEMQGDINRGDVLVFHMTDGEAPPGAIVILNVKRQTIPSVRRVRSGAGTIRFVSTNEDYDPLETSEARIFGRAIMHLRKL